MYRLILYRKGEEYMRTQPRPQIEDWLITQSYFLYKPDRHEIVEDDEDEWTK